MNDWISWINTHPFLGLLIIAWSVIWKGLALWEAAKRREKYWFIALLLLNTFGIVEIIYLLFIAKSLKLMRRG